MVLAVVAVLLGAVCGFIALRVNQATLMERAVEQRVRRLRLLHAHEQATGDLVPAVVEEMWAAFPAPNPGCVAIHDLDGTERFRTPAHLPPALLPDARLVPLDGGPLVSMRELLAREGVWAGWTHPPGRGAQLVVGHTDLVRRSVLVMRVPRDELEMGLARQSLPWVLALVLPGVIAAGTLLLLVLWLRRAGAMAREATHALEQARWQLDTLAENVDEVLYISDPSQGVALYVSPSYGRVFGRPPQGLLADGNDFLAAVHPEDRAVFAHPRERTDGVQEVEYRVLREGEVRRLRSRWRPFPRPGGGPPLYAGVTEDVTAQHEAREALRESEERFRTLAEALPIGVSLHDAQGRTVYVNPAFARISGREGGELLSPDAWRASLHPEDAPRVLQQWVDYLTSGADTVVSEHRMVRGSGEVRHLHAVGQRMRAPDGTDTGTVVVIDDVTERRAAERQQRMSMGLLDTSSDFIGMADPRTGKMLYLNRAGRRLVGLPEDGPLDVAVAAFEAPFERDFLHHTMRPTVNATGRWHGERHLVHQQTGEAILVESTIFALREHEGQSPPAAVGTVMRDIRERRAAEQALRQSEARLSSLVGSAMDAIVSVDAQHRVVLFNAAAEELFGVPASEALGGPGARFIPERFRARLPQLLERVPPEGQAPRPVGQRGQYTALRADGTELPVEASASHVALADGDHLFTVILRDQRERLALEAQLRQAQKMEAVGQLAGGIAHDFNNLLSVILSMTNLVLQDLPDDGTPLREDLAEVHRAAERAATLTRQLLAFSRRQVVAPRLLDLNRVVREAQTLLRRAVRDDVHLQVELADLALPVRADPGQLEQVLMNLTVNARDAMPQGGTLTLQTGAVHLDAEEAPAAGVPAPGDYVVLSVRDTGVGMDAGVKARIFEPFFTTKAPGQGTGLGLATVYGIVAAAGGGVRVDSEPGRGAHFTLALPRASALPEEVAGGAHRPLPRGSETVLLVEDEQAVRTATRRILERSGYRVLEARHGADALLVWSQHRDEVALVLTDVMMPELGGLELAARLAEQAPRLPVVFLSGYTDTPPSVSDVPPVRSFLAKPPSLEELVTEVRRVLDLR